MTQNVNTDKFSLKKPLNYNLFEPQFNNIIFSIFIFFFYLKEFGNKMKKKKKKNT